MENNLNDQNNLLLSRPVEKLGFSVVITNYIFITLHKMSGRKPTIINSIATSPEGEVSKFYTLTDAANGLGFHRSTLKRVYDARSNWIGDYTLEWLEVGDKLKKEKSKEKKYRTIAEKVKKEKVESDKRRDQRLKFQGKPITKEVKNKCIYCGRDLSNQDKINYFALSEMNKKGEALSHKNYKRLNEASNDTSSIYRTRSCLIFRRQFRHHWGVHLSPIL